MTGLAISVAYRKTCPCLTAEGAESAELSISIGKSVGLRSQSAQVRRYAENKLGLAWTICRANRRTCSILVPHTSRDDLRWSVKIAASSPSSSATKAENSAATHTRKLRRIYFEVAKLDLLVIV